MEHFETEEDWAVNILANIWMGQTIEELDQEEVQCLKNTGNWEGIQQ